MRFGVADHTGGMRYDQTLCYLWKFDMPIDTRLDVVGDPGPGATQCIPHLGTGN